MSDLMRTRSRVARGETARKLLSKSGILDSDSPEDTTGEETSDIESEFSEYSSLQETSQSSSPVSDSPERESITPIESEKPVLKPVPKLNILEILCDSSSQESDINDANEVKPEQENGSSDLSSFVTHVTSSETPEKAPIKSANKLAAFATTIKSPEPEERQPKSANKLAAFATTIKSPEPEERQPKSANKLAAFATTIKFLEPEEVPVKTGNKLAAFVTKSVAFSDKIACSQDIANLDSYGDPIEKTIEELSAHDDSIPEEVPIYQKAKQKQDIPRELLIYETSQVEPHEMYVFAVHDEQGKLFLFCKSESVASGSNDYETCCLCIASPKVTISFLPYFDANRNEMEREAEAAVQNCNGIVFNKEWKTKKSLNQKSHEWLDVTVSSDIEIAKMKMKGKTYNKVVGLTPCLTDDLVSERKIKGGQWISVHCSQSPHHHTTVPMYAISHAEGIQLIDKKGKPAYNVCLMTVHTYCGRVILISMRIFSQWDVDTFSSHADATGSGQKVMSLVVSPKPKADQNADSTVYCPSEAALLACFVDKIDKEDIDILVGYDLKNLMPFLVSRMRANSVSDCHKLGRFARTEATATMKDITAGRMICDLKSYFQDFLDQPSDSFSDLVFSQLQVVRPNPSESKVQKLLSSKPSDFSSLIVWSRKDTLHMKNLLQKYYVLNACEYMARITGSQWIDSTWRGNETLVETYLINSLRAKGYMIPDLHPKANKGCFELPVPKIGIKHREMVLFEAPFWILKLMKDVNFCVTTITNDDTIKRKPSSVVSTMITELNNSLVRLEEQYPGLEDKDQKVKNESMRTAIGIICRAIPKYFNGTSHRFDLSLLSHVLKKEVEIFCDKMNSPAFITENYLVVEGADDNPFEQHQYKNITVKSSVNLKSIIVLGRDSFVANSESGERIEHNVSILRWDWCSITKQICSQLFEVIVSSQDIEYDLLGKVYELAKSDILSPKKTQDWSIPVLCSSQCVDDALRDCIERMEKSGQIGPFSDEATVIRCRNKVVKRQQDVRDVSEIDVSWYIETQIIPAVLLLTKHFVDFSEQEIRACFSDSEEEPPITEESLTYTCNHCSRMHRFTRVNVDLKCDHCGEKLNWKYLANALMRSVRSFVKRRASLWMNCNSFLCSYHTAQVPVSAQIMKHAGTHTFRTCCCGHQIMERNQQEIYSRLKDISSIFEEQRTSADNDVKNLVSTMREYLRTLVGHHDFSSMRLSSIMSPSSADTQSDDGACFSFIE